MKGESRSSKTPPRSEEELLGLIAERIPGNGAEVLAGIGDDCAVIRPPGTSGMLLLLKTDALAEGIHYSTGTTLSSLGWKALCRPISDVAAMGGIPRHALVTVGAPRSWSRADWKDLYDGIGKAARHHGVSVVGGETVRSRRDAFLSVALTGDVPKGSLRLRSGARPGDLICVTGKLGGSLESGRHLRFKPRCAEGQWLAARSAVTAMMDLSDGLGSDLPKLARASGCSYHVDLERLPRNRGCGLRGAISDGEDYELLLTLSPRGSGDLLRRWKKAFPSLPLTPVGRMIPGREASTRLLPGHDHLAPAPQKR